MEMHTNSKYESRRTVFMVSRARILNDKCTPLIIRSRLIISRILQKERRIGTQFRVFIQEYLVHYYAPPCRIPEETCEVLITVDVFRAYLPLRDDG